MREKDNASEPEVLARLDRDHLRVLLKEAMEQEPVDQERVRTLVALMNEAQEPAPEKPKRLRWGIPAMVILVLALGLGLFRLLSPKPQPSDPEHYQEFVNLLESEDLTAPMVPQYWPEEYRFFQLDRVEGFKSFTLILLRELLPGEDGHNVISIHVMDIPNTSMSFSKDDGEPEIYRYHNQDFVIFTNVGYYKCTWNVGTVQCSISGLKTRDELVKMIQSIYW